MGKDTGGLVNAGLFSTGNFPIESFKNFKQRGFNFPLETIQGG